MTAQNAPANRYAEQQAAEAQLCGELFTADTEFPPGPTVSKRRRRGPTITLDDIATYQPDTPSPTR